MGKQVFLSPAIEFETSGRDFPGAIVNKDRSGVANPDVSKGYGMKSHIQAAKRVFGGGPVFGSVEQDFQLLARDSRRCRLCNRATERREFAPNSRQVVFPEILMAWPGEPDRRVLRPLRRLREVVF